MASATNGNKNVRHVHVTVEAKAGFFEFVCSAGRDRNDMPFIFITSGTPKTCPICRGRIVPGPEVQTASIWDDRPLHAAAPEPEAVISDWVTR